MSATEAPPRPPIRSRSAARRAPRGWQRLLFGVVLALFLGAGLVAAAVFVWPSSAEGDLRFNLGSVEQFPPGTVTTFFGRTDGAVPAGSAAAREVGSGPSLGTFHVVRLPDGEVLALYARSTHLGCTVPFRPTFVFSNREGWFRDPCGGATWDMAGYRVFGPAQRGLDRFAVEVRDGKVYVDLGDLRPGPSMPEGYEAQTGGVLGPLSGG